MAEEIWKDIPGYEGKYAVSSMGRVLRSVWNNKPCIEHYVYPSQTINGYLHVGLNDGNKIKTFGIHRLMGLAFIPNPENLPEVGHKDHKPWNNVLDNLYWTSHADNVRHSWTKINRRPYERRRTSTYIKIFAQK